MSDESTAVAAPEVTTVVDGTTPNDTAEQAPEAKEAPADDPKTRAERLAQKVSAKMARRKEAVRRGEAELARARDEFTRNQAALQEQARSIEAHRQLVAKANAGDIDAMRELGFDYEAHTQALLKRGTPDEKIGALQKQLEAERKAREERDRREAEAQQHAAKAQVEQAFLAEFKPAEFPESLLYDPAEIVATGHILADQMAQQMGRAPSLREIALEIERRLAERHSKVREAGQKKVVETAKEAPKGKGKQSETISNRDAGERASGPKELTEEEKRELFRRFASEHFSDR